VFIRGQTFFPRYPCSSVANIHLPEGFELREGWLGPGEAGALFGALMQQVRWEVHRIVMFGKPVDSPRLSCWIGDPGTGYVYSRTRFEPRPWPPALAALRARIDGAAGVAMNSVLANLYRDGRDAMGWHSDDEPELGPRPVIASLSLGGTRRFAVKHRREPARRLTLELPPGSLLLMSGNSQADWRHALPRTARPVPPRINLTFRRVLPAPASR
jgi:alkylated DNA repair dioxygenase AlkB